MDGLNKEELLEEALFTRYLYHLGPSYSDFFMCPKINIEPINGDPRRHLIFGSALNYSGHHGGDYDKLTFSISDSNLSRITSDRRENKETYFAGRKRKAMPNF